MFTERETKLIRLAMDKAAHPGERDNCASMLIQSLLKRGISSEEFIRLSGPRVYEPHKEKKEREFKYNGKHVCPHCHGPDWGGYTFDFGKHKGQTLREVPLSYLHWCLNELVTSRPALVQAIKRYFDDKRTR